MCLSAACGGDRAQEIEAPAPQPEPPPQPEPAPQPETTTPDAVTLASFLGDTPRDPLDIVDRKKEAAIWTAVRDFYGARDHQPVWLTNPTRARALIEAIPDAERHGLVPEDYGLVVLGQYLAAVQESAPLPAEQRMALELGLTQAFFSLADDLATGRVTPKAVDASWHLHPDSPDLPAVLDQALRQDDIAGTLAALAPQQQDYARLMEALQRYRDIAAAGGWPQIPDGTMLAANQPNDPARVHLLRRRLAAEGYLPQPATSATLSITTNPPADTGSYDPALAEAVRQFQANHGLLVDGVVGPGTLRALNVPAQARAHQIALNLERWRWLPSTLGDPHIRVNIAGFHLGLYEDGRQVMSMPVIVGKQGWSTPFFSDAIDHVMLNPYWDVPRSIAIEDILPKVREDPSYLYEHHFVVLDGWGEEAPRVDPARIDWSNISAETFPYRFRQLPGPDNALGRIKFMFPNQFAIYLHDTPHDYLFDKRRRALSHGCIRVARPLDLADYLFRNDPSWNRLRFAQVIRSGRHMRVDLPAPMPVYLLYWTAFVNDQGHMQIRPDIYGVDSKQARALTKLEGA